MDPENKFFVITVVRIKHRNVKGMKLEVNDKEESQKCQRDEKTGTW